MNIVQPFLINENRCRGRMVKCDTLLRDVMQYQSYPPNVQKLLGEGVLLASLLASLMTFKGLFTLQIQGQGAVSLLVVNVTDAGQIKAYVKYNTVDPNVDKLLDFFGEGVMAMTVNNTQKPDENYQGIVQLAGDSLVACAERYLKQSERLRTHIHLFVSDDLKGAGLLIQEMPDQKSLPQVMLDDEWKTAVILVDSLKSSEVFDEALSSGKLLFRLFHANQLLEMPGKELSFQCSCSADKIKNMLKGFDETERSDMYVNGVLTVDCQFCGKSYIFKEGEEL